MKIDPVTEGEPSILDVIREQGDPTSGDNAAAIHDRATDSRADGPESLAPMTLHPRDCQVDLPGSDRYHRFIVTPA